MRIALTGNPNSGKTTMYNALTGRNEHVGNWAGVTVDKKESRVKQQFCCGNEEVIAVDLPGAYSMSAFTSEEGITSTYVKGENPDVIVNIVDATNLSRSLFFTTQLLELGIPVVVALNKSDMVEKQGVRIDLEELSKRLGCPVLATVSTLSKGNGLAQVIEAACLIAGKGQKAPYKNPEISVSDMDAAKRADRARYAFVNELVTKVETRKKGLFQQGTQDKIDELLTNKLLGIGIFAVVMFGVFDISQSTLGPYLAGILTGWIETFQGWAGEMLSGASPFSQALLVDGIIGGVGAVVGFLPLVMVMYFLIALLEDCGYMARVSVVLDPIFKKVGLSGKSVIPMVIGTGCAIPGVMACRTIRDERERRATAMLTPFMPCGAKLPVIGLFAGAFFADATWVGTLMYFVGIAIIFFGALLIQKITGYKNKKSYFIIELPEYKLPSLKRATLSMLSRGKAYIVKAGTIILVCNTVVQIMQSFNWKLQLVEEGMEQTSILASIASPIALLLVPIVGVAAWQLAAAAVTGFIAKENVVGTLAVCYALTSFIDVEEKVLVGGASEVALAMGLTQAGALAYLMFNLFTPPCFAALGAMNSEMQDCRWFWGGVALQFGTGYAVAYLVYQIGTLLTTGSVGAGFVPGGIVVLALIGVVIYLMKRSDARVVEFA